MRSVRSEGSTTERFYCLSYKAHFLAKINLNKEGTFVWLNLVYKVLPWYASVSCVLQPCDLSSFCMDKKIEFSKLFMWVILKF
jgi:hypothetical protein